MRAAPRGPPRQAAARRRRRSGAASAAGATAVGVGPTGAGAWRTTHSAARPLCPRPNRAGRLLLRCRRCRRHLRRGAPSPSSSATFQRGAPEQGLQQAKISDRGLTLPGSRPRAPPSQRPPLELGIRHDDSKKQLRTSFACRVLCSFCFVRLFQNRVLCSFVSLSHRVYESQTDRVSVRFYGHAILAA